MSYRTLTPDELIQIGQEYESYRRWESVREYVALLYGERAHSVTISVMSEYNDSSYDEKPNILVTDREGNRLRYNFTLPWWSQFTFTEEGLAEFQRYDDGDISDAWNLDSGEQVYHALEALCMEKLGIDFIEHWQPRDPITYTYVVDTPPTLSHSAVYVEE